MALSNQNHAPEEPQKADCPSASGSAAVLRWAERVLTEKGALQRIMRKPGDSPSDPEFCTALAVAAGASYKIIDGKITTQPCAIQFDGSRWVVGLPNNQIPSVDAPP